MLKTYHERVTVYTQPIKNMTIVRVNTTVLKGKTPT